MNKSALIALVVVTFIGGGVMTFNACSTRAVKGDTRLSQGGYGIKDTDTWHETATMVPTSDKLFLTGKYSIRATSTTGASDLNEDHTGEDLSLKAQRPVYNLTQTLFAQKYGKPGYTLVANFYHEGVFYIARIPDEGVRGVFFTLGLWPPKTGPKFFAAQTMIRFQMDKAHPIELVADVPDEMALKVLRGLPSDQALAKLPNENPDGDPRLENFAISAEAVQVESDANDPFSLATALHGGVTQALTFRSMEEPLVAFYKTGEPTNEYKLHVTPQEGNAIVTEAIRQSQAAGLDQRLAFAANCTSQPFMILKKALAVRDDRFSYLQRMMEQKIPTAGPKKLVENGLEGEIPLHWDRSLGDDSNVAFGRVFGGRDNDICKTSKVYRSYHCDQIHDAVKALETWGRLPASTKPAIDIPSDAGYKEKLSPADEKAALAEERREQELNRSARKKGLGAASGYESDDVLH